LQVPNCDAAAAAARDNAPFWVRALALAGMYAGNHWGMPYTLGQSRFNQDAAAMLLLSVQVMVACVCGG